MLESLGARLTVIVEPGAPDEEALRALARCGDPVLLIPFHAHRDRHDQLVHGLSVISQLRESQLPQRALPVLCPISSVGLAAAELMTSRTHEASLARVRFISESELGHPDLPGSIRAFLLETGVFGTDE